MDWLSVAIGWILTFILTLLICDVVNQFINKK